MAGLDRIASGLAQRGEPVGRLVARSGQQLAAHPPPLTNPGSTGHTGTREASEGNPAAAAPAASSAPGSAPLSQVVAEPAPPQPGAGAKALAAVGAAFAKGIELEQLISAPLAKLPSLAFPALCVGDWAIGTPHAHSHPPNITPPNPVPVPLPSLGQIFPIPYLSGATKTIIEGRPAARCGDLGASIFCGGFFPMSEVFFGSASVWVEGARQARGLIDITKHCIFSTPKPNDPPIGPFLGMTVPQTTRTLVGGIPMPSLLSMGMGALFKGLFKGIAKVAARLRNAIVVARFLKHASIHGDDAFKNLVKQDLQRMGRTAQGRAILNRIRQSGKKLEIHHPNSTAQTAADFAQYGDHCAPLGNNGHVKMQYDPQGPYLAEFTDGNMYPVSVTGKGSGEGSRVVYNPEGWPNVDNPGSPSDVILAHELNHAANNAAGEGQGLLRDPDPNWNHDWTNYEEHNTVAAENAYREQRGGVPQRDNYRTLP